MPIKERMTELKITASTDVGMRHEQNQDCYKAGRLSDDTYWIVLCDGMGGVSAGGEASFLAVNCLEQALTETLLDMSSPEEVNKFLGITLKRCNQTIWNIANAEGDVITMGTTVVMAVIRNGLAQIVHAGDSRAYVMQKKVLRQITRDHSMVQELLDSGKITEEQARSHSHRNIITRALGVEPEIEVAYNEVSLGRDDVLLLCTDGLSNMVNDDEIQSIIRESNFYRSADNLVKKAVANGGFDNVTAVLFSQ